jgi:DNA-binding transcriptional LysR family regulator
MPFRQLKDSIPISALRAFVAISELGSFTKAAENLNLTQPAVSLQIKQMERILGGELFVKKKGGVALSDLGTTVDRLARRMLSLNNQLIGIAGRVALRETIHLGIQGVYAHIVLPRLFRQCRILDNVHYKFDCAHTGELAEKIKSGFVDLTFMIGVNEPRRNLIDEWTEKFVWVRAPHHRSVAEDGTIPFIARQDGMMDRTVFKLLDERGIPYRIVFSATDIACMYAAVESGIGLMCMPARAVPDSLVIARERHLPKLPDLHLGVYHAEGFDVPRHQALVDAFISAVRPPKPGEVAGDETDALRSVRPAEAERTETEKIDS